MTAVPELVVSPSPVPRPQGPAHEVWLDSSGNPIAHGWVREDGMELSFPDLGLYRFSGDGPVWTAPYAESGRPLLGGTYWKSVVPFVLQARGREALHASAILSSRGVAAFCAVSGTGKSTLARALCRQGYQPWADDAVLLDGPVALPLPFQAKLRRAPAALFAEPELSEFAWPADAHPLAALFVLERGGESEVSCRRISPAAAFRSLLCHAFCFTLSAPERKRAMISSYLGLAERVPVFELRFPAGLEHLPAMVAAVEATLAG